MCVLCLSTFLLFGRLGDVFHDHALNALPDHRRGRVDQTQLFPALGHLLLHLLFVSGAACALDQLMVETISYGFVKKTYWDVQRLLFALQTIKSACDNSERWHWRFYFLTFCVCAVAHFLPFQHSIAQHQPTTLRC